MKIYPNPHFPRRRPELAPPALAPRRERIDTMTFVSELEARNAKALKQLLEKRPQGDPQAGQKRKQKNSGKKQRFFGRTGPPIDAPGGHVHSVYRASELEGK